MRRFCIGLARFLLAAGEQTVDFERRADEDFRRARRAVEDQVAEINKMRAGPPKVLKAPGTEGTLHKPTGKVEAKPGEAKKAGADAAATKK